VQPPVYGEDEITDRSERFLAAEMVREQLMLRLDQELPYATTVEIEQFSDRPTALRKSTPIIWVERDGQKAIVIGERRRPAQGDRHEARGATWSACSSARCSSSCG
jgi:GTP-binding protein Era